MATTENGPGGQHNGDLEIAYDQMVLSGCDIAFV